MTLTPSTGASPPPLVYALCATPGAGGALLAKLLEATGLAGAPERLFERARFERACREHGVTTAAEVLAAEVGRRHSSGGVRGIQLAWEDRERLRAAGPRGLRVVWLTRRDKLAQAADEVLRRNFDARSLAPLRDRIDRMNAAYRDVEPGDRYALTYVPGQGTELALNGKPLVRIPGADFAKAYFAIWLGPDPADEKFKRQLLTGSRS